MRRIRRATVRALRTRHGIVGSMSRKGDGWDNVPIESLFFDYIEVSYNRIGRRSALDCPSPG
ncbi:hypothetical protein DCC79_00435 [bacterium]|nr:MAG: hypothetical protein DCC79_00435 [bacterium]